MGRPSNTLQRREEISSALIRVMAIHGYHGATIAKIAAEAGLAPGLILYHFESKSDILMHAVESLSATFESRLGERLAASGDDPRQRLHAFIDSHLALGRDADEAAVAAWVVIAAQAVRDNEVRKVYARSVATRMRELEKLVGAALRQSRGHARGSRQSAAVILSAIEGSFLLSAAAPGTLPRGYAAPAVRQLVDGLMG